MLQYLFQQLIPRFDKKKWDWKWMKEVMEKFTPVEHEGAKI